MSPKDNAAASKYIPLKKSPFTKGKNANIRLASPVIPLPYKAASWIVKTVVFGSLLILSYLPSPS